MKQLSIAVLVALLSAWTLPAASPAEAGATSEQDPKSAEKPRDSVAPASAGGSALVDAAKKNKKSRGKSTTKVITNSDVKKSKGKLLVVDKPAPPAVATSSVGPFTQHAADRKAIRDAEEILALEEKKVAELEKELFRIEQSYYDENDPNYRDEVIQKRFDQTRRQLDDARQNLADARDALERLSAPRP
jgi:hypothetical protein